MTFLVFEKFVDRLHAASSGQIGIISRIVEQAVAIAGEKGSPQVLPQHVGEAIDGCPLLKGPTTRSASIEL
jgi:hypothetical protein